MSDVRTNEWSAPATALHDRMRSHLDRGSRAAVATVVDVAGSAYRRPGAKMLVPAAGDAAGAITAGCLEGPVVDIARDVLAGGAPRTETFDLTDDDEWGLGLGCNGVIDVFVEPLDGSWEPALDALADGESATMVTVTRSTDDAVGPGARAYLSADGETAATADRDPIPDAVLDRVGDVEPGESGTATVDVDGGAVDVFAEGLEPPAELLLFGWQPDVRPVARVGRDAGFRVTVAAGRGGKADPEAFPAAHRVVATRPADVVDAVRAPERTYAVLMSHNFVDDRLALESLLGAAVPYVGLMGPRKRFERMRDDLAAAGVELSAAQLDRVATPVGLDLGGGEPTQIALSVVSEALAAKNGRGGGRLRDVEGPIHPRSDPDAIRS